MTYVTTSMLLKIITVLWVIWGLVHISAGVMTISLSAPNSIAGIADAVDPVLLEGTYHPAVSAVINQHGFNLFWIGVFTTLGAVFVWRRSTISMFFTAVVGGMADVGYFIFMDLGGFVNFLPGTIMTLVSGLAIVLSFVAWQFGMRDKTILSNTN